MLTPWAFSSVHLAKSLRIPLKNTLQLRSWGSDVEGLSSSNFAANNYRHLHSLHRDYQKVAVLHVTVSSGQTTGNIWAPKYYIFPINDLPHRPPSEKSDKSGKIPSKGHSRAHTLVEFKERFPDQFFTICKQRRNPFFQIHAQGSKYRYPCTQSAGGVQK